MKQIFIVMNMDDEPVLAFSNEELAQTVANTSKGLEDMIYSVMLRDRGEHGSSEDMPS